MFVTLFCTLGDKKTSQSVKKSALKSLCRVFLSLWDTLS